MREISRFVRSLWSDFVRYIWTARAMWMYSDWLGKLADGDYLFFGGKDDRCNGIRPVL